MSARVIGSLGVVSVLLSSTVALAHVAGLDAYGCHSDAQPGSPGAGVWSHPPGDPKGSGYHCHVGRFAGQSFGSQAEMLQILQKQQAAENVPPWKRPGRCVERIPARTLPNMPPWSQNQPAEVLSSDDCSDTKTNGGTCICIDQRGIDASTKCCAQTRKLSKPPWIEGGVCSCKEGAVICCDGSASVTCTCREAK